MSYFKLEAQEFAKRTKDILDNAGTEYDVTLTLNCLLGLLVVPKELGKISKNKLRPGGILESKHDLKDWLRRMRNALAHAEIILNPTDGDPKAIESVTFSNNRYNNCSQANWQETLKAPELKQLADELCEAVEAN